jgi:hypothetical protein
MARLGSTGTHPDKKTLLRFPSRYLSFVVLAASLVLCSRVLAANPPAFRGENTRLSPTRLGTGAFFGYAVALAADGRTAIVGAPRDDGDRGGAYIFVRRGRTWTEQTSLSVPRGPGLDGFGQAVALSASGNTAVVGAPLSDRQVGEAWVFERSATRWREEARLSPREERGAGYFGWATALSANGHVVVVTAPDDRREAGQKVGHGAVWTFIRRGSTWHQSGQKLIARGESPGGGFGGSIAISADGGDAVIGAPLDGEGRGAAWFFQRRGPVWRGVGSKVTGQNETGAGEFGYALAISGDGRVAMISAFYDGAPKRGDGGPGAVWTYSRSHAGWGQIGTKLESPVPEPQGSFGTSIGLSSHGEIAVVGAGAEHLTSGDVWILMRKGSGWISRPAPLLPLPPATGKSVFGFSVALTPAGTAALIGAPGADKKRGTAAVYLVRS